MEFLVLDVFIAIILFIGFRPHQKTVLRKDSFHFIFFVSDFVLRAIPSGAQGLATLA